MSNLYWQNADGTGAPERLTTSAHMQFLAPGIRSRRFLAFSEVVGASNLDLMVLPMEGDDRSGWKPGTPTRFTSGPFVEREPAFSPDGRWIAYVSNESGRDEVTRRHSPTAGHARQCRAAAETSPRVTRQPGAVLQRRRENHGRPIHDRGTPSFRRRCASGRTCDSVPA